MTAPAQRRVGRLFRFGQRLLRGFFRVFYLLEVRGLEQVPAAGPVIIAANHVNPLDAVLLGACAPGRMRFVVWNKTFGLPLIGFLLRLTGCIPINRDRPDTSAFKEALRWLAGGEILGIFPEGRYTETGHLHELKPGTLRIALTAGAAVVPATLTGAYRAWPLRGLNSRLFPRPWKITLRFHPPLSTAGAVAEPSPEPSPQPSPVGREREIVMAAAASPIAGQRAAAVELTAQLATAINSALEPAIRAEDKIEVLLTRPAPHVRLYEWFLGVVLVATRDPWAAVLAGVYCGYLLLDVYGLRPTVATRALRNFLPVAILAAAYPVLVRLIGPMPDRLWWAVGGVGLGYVLWSLVQYCFAKYLQSQRYVRGLLLTLYLGLLALLWMPRLPRPSLLVGLALYALVFDFGQARRRWLGFGLALAALVVAAMVATRYPWAALALNAGVVTAVFGYMHVFKMRAHDGRRI